ncbi:22329_t:CDS:1, partial [Gigaspora margarita]
LKILTIKESIIEYKDDYVIEDNNGDKNYKYAIEDDKDKKIIIKIWIT